MKTFLPKNEKQLSGFPQLSGEKLESLSIKVFRAFRVAFRAFRGNYRGTRRETTMDRGFPLSGLSAPYGGVPTAESWGHPPGVSPMFLERKIFPASELKKRI